jgi:chemotaxis protein methyltransferase CheR
VLDDQAREKIEIVLLLEGIAKRYGYDFRNYASASLKRRLRHNLAASKCNNFVELLNKVLADKNCFESLLYDLSVTVTEMFRDPEVYKNLRLHVIPFLKTYPFIKIWHAGCATGEEVYSIAILLHEEGLLDRTQIYATDINLQALEIAREGIYSVEQIKKYSKSYQLSGGKSSFSDYYHAKYGSAKMVDFLKQKMIFSYHNLAVDHAFCEAQLIICRNVLIYFDGTLQNRVFKLFNDSLSNGGFLFLGTKESLSFSEIKDQFTLIAPQERLYQKFYPGKENGHG